MVGDSHARELTIHGTKLGVANVKFVHLASLWPAEFEIDWLRVNLCSYAVVAYGQWPASFVTKNRPFTQAKYQHDMRRVVGLLQQYDRNRTQVFLRSENYKSPPVRLQTTALHLLLMPTTLY
eukprot:gene16147-18433_t